MNVMHLNHPQTIPLLPGPWKNCLPCNLSLVPKTWGITALEHLLPLGILSFFQQNNLIQVYQKVNR